MREISFESTLRVRDKFRIEFKIQLKTLERERITTMRVKKKKKERLCIVRNCIKIKITFPLVFSFLLNRPSIVSTISVVGVERTPREKQNGGGSDIITRKIWQIISRG